MPTPGNTQETIYASSPLPWRRQTPLHHKMGAQVLRNAGPVILTANQPITLFQGQFGPRSIDRIIGASLRFGGVNGPISLMLSELITGFIWQVQGSTHLGVYNFNVETPLDYANITLVASANVTAAQNATWSLYNFEIPPASFGHSG